MGCVLYGNEQSAEDLAEHLSSTAFETLEEQQERDIVSADSLPVGRALLRLERRWTHPGLAAVPQPALKRTCRCRLAPAELRLETHRVDRDLGYDSSRS